MRLLARARSFLLGLFKRRRLERQMESEWAAHVECRAEALIASGLSAPEWGEPTQKQNEWAIGFLSIALRTSGDMAASVPAVREIVSTVDPNIGIDGLVPMERLVASSVARPRFYAVMLGVFAAIAAVLAAIGIYGVLAYAVVQRTHEIGIRMALGAQRAQVLAIVLRRGVMLTATGIVLGLLGAAAGTRFIRSMLFGVTPLDPTTFIVVALAFGLVATLASFIPARRATKVDPLVALRCEWR